MSVNQAIWVSGGPASVLVRPAFLSRLPIVPVDSSEARIPLPFAANRFAISGKVSPMASGVRIVEVSGLQLQVECHPV